MINMHLIIISVACILSVFCGILGVGISLYTYLQWKARDLSTHNIQYVPTDPNWGTTDEQFQEINESLGDYNTDFNMGIEAGR